MRYFRYTKSGFFHCPLTTNLSYNPMALDLITIMRINVHAACLHSPPWAPGLLHGRHDSLWWPGSKACILESDPAPFLILLVRAVGQERGREMAGALPHLPQQAVAESIRTPHGRRHYDISSFQAALFRSLLSPRCLPAAASLH